MAPASELIWATGFSLNFLLTRALNSFTKSTNFLYLFIASIIVGSILSMDRRVLIQGFVKIFIPLAAGSVAGRNPTRSAPVSKPASLPQRR